MRKPSIFSKDYERRMKKRRIQILLVVIVILIFGAGITFKLNVTPIDFTAIKQKLQSWVDSGKTQEELELEKDPILEEEPPKEEIKKEMDITVREGLVLKATYDEIEGVKTFKEFTPIEGIAVEVSPLKDKALLTEQNQEMYLININGEVVNITKRSYISTKNQEFTKESVLTDRPDFIWGNGGKFINDNVIVYVSLLPYIGKSAVNQYVWLYNITDGTHKSLLGLKGKVVTIGNIIPEKGIEINIDGTISILNPEGAIVQ